VEGDQGAKSEAALRHRHERWQAIRDRRLWENWNDPATGEWIRTFAIVTTDANSLVAEIHDRMPLILAAGDYDRWLGDEPDPHDLMRPFPPEPMRMWPISTRVNKPENNDPSILEPVDLPAGAVVTALR
jgi:putative SOS response-associated peptidase YedK